jgi:hypothetical protein
MAWPNLPSSDDQAALKKARYQAQLDNELASRRELAAEAAADAQLRRDLQKSAQDAEVALNQSVHDARINIAQTAIERGLSGAEFVRNAAAGIVTLYTGLLGVTYATTNGGTTLPARGIAPAILLGLGLACATAYAALLSQTPRAMAPKPHSDLATFQGRRLNAFIDWASNIAMGRAYFLHASVFALFFGVLSLPAPFINISDRFVIFSTAAFFFASVLLPARTAS